MSNMRPVLQERVRCSSDRCPDLLKRRKSGT